MKEHDISRLIRLFAAPVAAVLLGLVLLFSPDTASALIGKLLAWCAILAALAFGAGAFLGAPAGRKSRILWAVICFAAGVWLLRNPLTVARFLGRVLGIALMIRGGQSTADNIRWNGKKLVFSRALILGVVTLAIGAVLVILPLASSRMLFNVIGIVLICAGSAQCWDNLRGRKLLDEGDDPDIIDVEAL